MDYSTYLTGGVVRNDESDFNVVFEAAALLALMTWIYYLEAYVILLCGFYGYVLGHMYCRTAFGRRTNRKLKAFFRRKPSST